ncbi:hypothetical protein FRC01_010484 [Tulasnella sp. 417]|nr:hypothetical protein FRC01_010484 [Tulasnella sp. 417]
MSPIQEIVNLAVQAYFQHYSTPEQSTLLATDPSLTAESSKDSMIKVLESVQSLVNEEIIKRTTDLKRRRNQVHASIYQLPHEIFAEILAVVGSATLNISKALILMNVSKYWCDTVTQHPHIRLRVDVTPRRQPGKMTILGMLRGPIEIECLQDPSDLHDSLADLATATLDPTRFQVLRWHSSPRTKALHSFFQEQNSNIIDLAVEGNHTRPGISRRLELSPEGRCLRHVDLRNITVPWASPRLSQLQTLALESLNRGEYPSADDLYRILSLSPALRRIRLRHLYNAVHEDSALPLTKEPLFLPVLRSLHFSGSTSDIILPLLRAPSCQNLSASPQWAPSKNGDAILDLITSSMASQSTMAVKVEGIKGVPSVLLTSSPHNSRSALGDWDDHDTGITVRLIPSTVEGLRNLFEGLISRLQAARWRPARLTLELDVHDDALGAQMVLPLLCRFPLAFDTITSLTLMSRSPSTHSSALRLLEDGIPELTFLKTWTHPYFPFDAKEWANGIKAFLERRYPLHLQDAPDAPQQLSRLSSIDVPGPVAKYLRRDPPATSLSMSELLRGVIYQ